VSGFTQLGLVEMTRKRTRESLAHMLCEPCPTCQGRGQVKTARSVCYDILREILREARQFNPREFRVVASAPGGGDAAGRGKPAPGRVVDFIGKPISLQAEAVDGARAVRHRAVVVWRSAGRCAGGGCIAQRRRAISRQQRMECGHQRPAH
jgi:Ribonuclease G/E